MVGDLQGLVGVLLNEQDGDSLLIEFLDDLEHLRHDHGGKAQGRLVEHHEFWPGHDAAGDCQHLLFTAGEQAAVLTLALLQAGKHRIDPLKVLFNAVHVLAVAGADAQVLFHGELGKNLSGLRDLNQAGFHDLIGLVGDGFAVKLNGAVGALHDRRNALEQRGLAGAVGAQDGDDLALFHFQRNAAEGVNAAICRFQIFNL